LNLTALEVDRSENRIAFNRQRAEELAGRHGQIAAEIAEAATRAAEWDSRNAAQQHAVIGLRDESWRVGRARGGTWARAETRGAQIRDWELRIEALRASASEAGESLLRLHGEQKQAEEALVHQNAALQKREANEAELLESSIKVRDDAERAALEFEAASGQLGALTVKAAELQTSIGALRQERERMSAEADALRESVVGVRARHATLTQILNDRSYTANAVQKLFCRE